jgi:hypothetical protein
MTWKLDRKELEAVPGLPAPERYAHFVKRTADWEEVWGLRDDRGWVTAIDAEGRTFMPVWPHPEYARVCAAGAWENASAASIDVDEFVERSLPSLEDQGYLVSVFPAPTGNGVAVEPGRLRHDLEAELERYE